MDTPVDIIYSGVEVVRNSVNVLYKNMWTTVGQISGLYRGCQDVFTTDITFTSYLQVVNNISTALC